MEMSQEQAPRWLSLDAAVRHYDAGTRTTPDCGTREYLLMLIDQRALAGRKVPGRFFADEPKIEVRADGLGRLIDLALESHLRRGDDEAELAS